MHDVSAPPTPTEEPLGPKPARRRGSDVAALLALALGAFAVGTTEVVVAGLLPEVAADLGVSLPTAGLLVSAFALGIVVGAPLLTVLGTRMPRKRLLLWLVALFIVASLISAVAPGYATLLVGRVLSALAGGAYVAIASVIAAGIVAPERRASAIATVFMGLSLANVLGVPGGTAVGQAFGWRSTFWGVTVIGVVLFAALAALVPFVPRPEGANPRGELAVFRRGSLWLSLAATAFGWAPFLTVLTYISPLLTEVGGFDDRTVPLVLVLIGVGMLLGTPLAGRLADRALVPTLYGAVGGLALVSVLLVLAVHSKPAAIVGFLLFGAIGAAVIPPMQARVVASAAGADNLASAANISAFNIGNGGGPLLAGWALSLGGGYTAPLWIAGALGAVGLVLAVAQPRGRTR
ncbi:MFS transporter, DHA1 family, arabinose polymer transporter [Streptoalloteichus tenebrarius]|uniref:MFS transporter, DHA1 family, arabinose polymer transporter n=1 Tax=Streptoalloteichus tenebrarius (strain ATCC 17920 / DSM 40477 / JCM 4838 / CBS 697.72 / NBRC 16177 / NCIMB 11028 / NRRL B-12390 / A12253. 1 / ISP 5477) TaxID=1933 RepID=A0ABT1HQ24_STRSD|nr:MFS transporter [Streptoalloteichus tenebrarius]MCP2257612.1 MFS transporter, DHA1 family, arabinose polymer transporter [Streptoalloteichus tenebrarius]BFE98569.1 MFS transporter [Streptoalloteichus tenebrarius]